MKFMTLLVGIIKKMLNNKNDEIFVERFCTIKKRISIRCLFKGELLSVR